MLKYILNRLRYSLGQDHLETFMLIAIEKDVVQSLDHNNIIKHLIENCKSQRIFVILKHILDKVQIFFRIALLIMLVYV